MSTQKKVEAIELAIEILQEKLTKLKVNVAPDEPIPDENGRCPGGYYNNGKGQCILDVG